MNHKKQTVKPIILKIRFFTEINQIKEWDLGLIIEWGAYQRASLWIAMSNSVKKAHCNVMRLATRFFLSYICGCILHSHKIGLHVSLNYDRTPVLHFTYPDQGCFCQLAIVSKSFRDHWIAQFKTIILFISIDFIW